MEKDIELKPCPICGSEVNMIEENVGEYTVVCHGCQVLMIADDVSSKDDAIERWNNRVNEPEWILIKDSRFLRQKTMSRCIHLLQHYL